MRKAEQLARLLAKAQIDPDAREWHQLSPLDRQRLHNHADAILVALTPIPRAVGADACGITGCDRPRRSKWAQLCKMHSERIRRTGTPEPLDHTESKEAVVARFTSQIEKTATCWIWTGTVGDDGYGKFRCHGRHWVASRFAHDLWIGPIPDGYEVDHVRARGCVDTRCVNPAHLEAVTRTENNARSTSPSAVNATKTHCIHGHEFTPENTSTEKHRDKLKRVCRKCFNKRQRERLARRRVEVAPGQGEVDRG